MQLHFLDRFLEIRKKKVWPRCHEDEDCGCFVSVRVSAEEGASERASETVMETLLLSAWETDALLFLNFGATPVPRQKAE